MKIFIASDHAGYDLKNYLLNNIVIEGYELIDLGTNSKESVDYPDYAFNLSEKVLEEKSLGIVICGTGIGVSIASNKVRGIRCAKVDSVKEASLARSHNDANIIALASYTEISLALDIVKTFIKKEFSNEERHITRINKISEYEDKYEC